VVISLLFIIHREALAKKLKSIRWYGYEEADTKGQQLSGILGYNGELELEEVEALLIAFVEQFLKSSKVKRDRALMALGFLAGYEGKGIGGRREKYLIESGCLEREYPDEYTKYLQCQNKKARKEILNDVGKNSLRSKEDTILRNLANSISSQIKDMPAYIDDIKKQTQTQRNGNNHGVKYPSPHYLNAGEEYNAPPLDSMISVPDVPTWGPSNRPTFTIENPAGYVTFNSITNNPKYGDERNFAHIKESGAADSTYTNKISLKAGQEYTVFVYYHNNAASNLNASGKGIAHGAYIKAELPANVLKGATNAGSNIYIGASNANPNQVFDNIYFANSTNADITLRYVQGSAVLTNFKSDTDNTLRTFKLSDSIVDSGAAIGWDSMNGDVPGCNRYSGYVTFKIKAVQPSFSVSKQVRPAGTASGGWVESLAVNPGDEVEYMITYKNTGTVNQENVIVSDTLPNGVSYVKGSTKLTNGNGSNQVMPDAVTTNGLNIGTYAPNAVAYTWFKAKVADAKALECGKTLSLVNTGRISTANGANTDDATITVRVEKPRLLLIKRHVLRYK
jgi:uncharacterized repeat protein (TIGR01451 family)